MGMSELVFVEMVDVGDAEVEGREEDDVGRGYFREKVERDDT